MLTLHLKSIYVYTMKYSQRYQELNIQFRLGVDTHLIESNIDIRHFSFRSNYIPDSCGNTTKASPDENIEENTSFVYPVFMPCNVKQADKAILLLHGLNERNWNKYLTWAEFLCSTTGKPVILFPIAFHMNRSPLNWSNPRTLQTVMNLRRQLNGEDRSLSFANVALSNRISERPYRFYSSGRQSVQDLSLLFEQIKQGNHPLFQENTKPDIFAYSIGAFLAEITLLANPRNLFSESKLFLLCGGGIFSSMAGESRSIMDKTAFHTLYDYYLNQFYQSEETNCTKDDLFHSFNSMISTERDKSERELFFTRLGNRLKGISLVNDQVMPYQGIPDALGTICSENRITQLDFSFPYTHEHPFPVGGLTDSRAVDDGFIQIFSQAAEFLN